MVWMNLEYILLSEEASHTWKNVAVPFAQNIQNEQIHGMRKQTTGLNRTR